MAILRPNGWGTWDTAKKYAFACRANKLAMWLHNKFGIWKNSSLPQETYNNFPQMIKDRYEWKITLTPEEYAQFLRVDFYRMDQAIQTTMASLNEDLHSDMSVAVDLVNDIVDE